MPHSLIDRYLFRELLAPTLVVNAGIHAPDGIILDLEDSVHHAEKDAARLLVRNALRTIDFGTWERMVRINPLPLGAEEIAALVPEGVDVILVPKAEAGNQIREIDQRIGEALKQAGLDRPVWLMPILETAKGIENAYEVAAASPRVAALTIGLEDYTADLGVAKTPEGVESHWARSRVVEYLSKIQSRLPQGVETELGPDATGVGWVFQYALADRSGKHSLDELRSFQDWTLRYALQSVPGVAIVSRLILFQPWSSVPCACS